jgi:folylpolyglutamate synthase/dihydropteroate synthase
MSEKGDCNQHIIVFSYIHYCITPFSRMDQIKETTRPSLDEFELVTIKCFLYFQPNLLNYIYIPKLQEKWHKRVKTIF